MLPNARRSATLILAGIAGLEAVALAQLTFYPAMRMDFGPYSSIVWFDAATYGWLAPFSILPLLVVLYCWLLKWGALKAQKHPSQVGRALSVIRALLTRFGLPSDEDGSLSVFRQRKMLPFLALVTGALIGIFAYRPDLNPAGVPVGVDTLQYVGWVREMLGGSTSQAVSFAFGGASFGSRPLPLVLFYSIAAFGASPEQVVKYSPVLLGPLLAFSCYVFVRAGRGDGEAAVVAAIFGSLSFDTTVGIWAGYFWFTIMRIVVV